MSSARCNQQAYGARRDLPNRVTTWKSRTQQTFAFNKSQILFESDTYIGNNISWDIAKYYFTIPSIHYPTPFMGECWSINVFVMVCLHTYISVKRTTVES